MLKLCRHYLQKSWWFNKKIKRFPTKVKCAVHSKLLQINDLSFCYITKHILNPVLYWISNQVLSSHVVLEYSSSKLNEIIKFSNKFSHRNLYMFSLKLLIYGEKQQQNFRPKFIYDDLRNSFIAILTKNRFLQHVQKIELRNRGWLGNLLAANPSKNVHLWQYLSMKLSFMFRFPQFPFAFTLILGGAYLYECL